MYYIPFAWTSLHRHSLGAELELIGRGDEVRLVRRRSVENAAVIVFIHASR